MPAQYADFANTLANQERQESEQDNQRAGAAVMVFQDGHAYVDENVEFRVPIVFDNLIHSGDMPVTMGVFIDPGHLDDKLPGEKPGWSPLPSNRRVEYDTLSDAYARFLLEEILPELGKRYRLSSDPDWRAIGGISSGGICAFTVAWHRPDAFRKVLSHVGSFTNIHGGHVYPSLIRKSEKRPVRIFLQAGRNDLDNQYGNWWLSNLQMEATLKFANYEHRFVGGNGGHDGSTAARSYRTHCAGYGAGGSPMAQLTRLFQPGEVQIAIPWVLIYRSELSGPNQGADPAPKNLERRPCSATENHQCDTCAH